MHSGLKFLVAAKRCEIAGLQQLALTSALVNVTARLVHGLQRERGLANLYLVSHGAAVVAGRDPLATDNDRVALELRACFDGMAQATTQTGSETRLFSRIAYVLQGLDALPLLRRRVQDHALSAEHSTAAYVRLIGALLAVVFEAADSANDPDISRLLLALFNFMQGKELAGQERAGGAAAFLSGKALLPPQQRLLHLIDSQDRCFKVFADFAPAPLPALWRQQQASTPMAEFERLRRVLCTASDGAPLDPACSQVWFDVCTLRMDAMKAIEDHLADALRGLCAERIAAAHVDLARYDGLVAHLQALERPTSVPDSSAPLPFFDDLQQSPDPATAIDTANQTYGPQLERSVLGLMQEQAQRLQTVSDELETVRASLNERKVIERAKGLLMAHRQLSEDAAHKTLRQMAMNQNRRLVDVAEAVLAMAAVLPAGRP